MGNISFPEILIILVIIVLLFGARRIPELARGLGEGIRNFKSGMKGDERKEIDERRYREDVERREESHRSA
jgi:sec-independent protein translocase protein TatA